MNARDQELINAIFSVRVMNNVPWQRIIEIAMEANPIATRAALAKVNDNDKAISGFVSELVK